MGMGHIISISALYIIPKGGFWELRSCRLLYLISPQMSTEFDNSDINLKY